LKTIIILSVLFTSLGCATYKRAISPWTDNNFGDIYTWCEKEWHFVEENKEPCVSSIWFWENYKTHYYKVD